MSIKTNIARHQNRFIGYWGNGNTQQLQRLVEHDWVIIPPPVSGSLISLSAAGLPPDDVWVRVDGNYLILGREVFGRVTLYWLQIDGVIWFSSQFQLLLPLVPEPQVSLPALYGYSCFSYIPTPLTPITQIMAVAAGTEQVWLAEAGKISPQSTRGLVDWSEAKTQLADESIAVGELQTLLVAAMERQTSDLRGKTVGVFLSGGLDSSIVAALLVRAGVKVRAYSLDFGVGEMSEYPYAAQVAEYLQIPLVKVDATPGTVRQAVLATIQSLDVPFGDGVTVPLYLLNQAASLDVDIVFNGEGGDQLFAGWTNKPLIAASIYQSVHPDGGECFSDRYLRTFHRLWGYEAQVFSSEVYGQIKHIRPQDWLEGALDETFSHALIHRLRRASLLLKGAQNIQPRATNLAFAHSLQVRSIFCDRELARWTFGVAGSLYLRGACEKYILKRAVEGWLPPEIVWREKRGMGVPLTSWCLGKWWGDLGRWLSSGGCWRADVAVRVALGDLGFRGRRVGEILWLLVSWDLWWGGSRGWRFWVPFWVWKRVRGG